MKETFKYENPLGVVDDILSFQCYGQPSDFFVIKALVL
jgi:hypothetical protein